MLFSQKSALILCLLAGLFGFEGLIDHRTDEVVQAEITLRFLGVLVYRRLWVGTSATCARQLRTVTLAVVGKQGLGFLFREVLGTRRKNRHGRRLLGFVGIENLLGHETRLPEEIDMRQLRSLRRVLLVIARIADGIGFLYAFMDNTTVIGTVLLHSVDDAFAFKCAVNLTDRVFKDSCCHNIEFVLLRCDRLAVGLLTYK